MNHKEIYAKANEMLQCAVVKDRQGWKTIRDTLPKEIKSIVLAREQEQRLMFKEFRYYSWCTVRPSQESK